MSSSSRWGQEVTILDPNMTFENFRFPKSKLNSNNNNVNKCGELNEKATTIFTDVISALSTNKTFRKGDFKFSDIESNLTSVSQAKQISPSTISTSSSENVVKKITQKEPSDISGDSVFTNAKEGIYQSYNGDNTTLSVSTKEYESDESFMTMAKREKHKYNFINPKNLSGHLKPLRVFNKNGKPLTDRMGRPLIDILGQPLVVFDDKGRIISDAKGNQVFNSLCESTIYSTTNLYIAPSEEEPGIPVLDIDKKHIMFLYDNKGHPLTDVLGRPLIKASGRPMFGMSPGEKLIVNNYINNQLKNLYSKAPLENFVRRVQIFDSDMRPLTDESGKQLRSATVICNKNGMPMCDENGHPLFFKYGTRIITPQIKNVDNDMLTSVKTLDKTPSQSSEDSLVESNFEERFKIEDSKRKEENKNCIETQDSVRLTTENKTNKSNYNSDLKRQSTSKITNQTLTSENKNSNNEDLFQKFPEESDRFLNTNQKLEMANCRSSIEKARSFNSSQEKVFKLHHKKLAHNDSKEAIVLFDASKKMDSQKSLMNTVMMNNFKGKHISHNIVQRKTRKKMYTSNFIEYFKNALNLTTLKQNDNRPIYNDYGKPMRDFYGNLLYDKFGIPLTGANGIQLSEKARHAIRLKLRNIPVLPVNKEKVEDKVHSLICNESHNQFGEPFYDKHGRPLYDLYGKLIYDIYGRPLTDAYGRPLIDAIGQPLMDSQGNVLTSDLNSTNNYALTDIFGRRLYDKRGRALFDSYGRPRYDIYTKAIYDNCGRPATDGYGNVLFDFLNKPIQQHPEKPLYKNSKALLPKYIDKILTLPSMIRVLKYSRSSLKDIFGGPLFDDFGRPLYNKLGKPLYDKYGRPLYDKDGRPLCDCYGRPLSEEIRHSLNDQTLSVVDSLKLLKLTKESSKWMEIKRSQTQTVKSTDSGILDNAIVMKVVQPAKKKATQYTYALTRVTRFACGRQAMEILEAPLSPSTATEMHHLPVDNKPLIMVERRRHRIIKKRRAAKNK